MPVSDNESLDRILRRGRFRKNDLRWFSTLLVLGLLFFTTGIVIDRDLPGLLGLLFFIGALIKAPWNRPAQFRWPN